MLRQGFQSAPGRDAPAPPAAAGPVWSGSAARAAARPRVGAHGGAARRGRSARAWPRRRTARRGRPTASTRSRTAVAATAWRSGRRRSGRRGMATSRAACAGSKRLRRHAEPGERAGPDPLQVAAERRQREPDVEHALTAEAGLELERAGQSRSAWSEACAGAAPAAGRPASPGSSRRRRRGRCAASWAVARASAIGSTPGWYQKRRSSTAISRLVSSGGAVPARKRQTPPAAGSSASGRSWRSTISVPIEDRRERSGGKAWSSARQPQAESDQGGDTEERTPPPCGRGGSAPTPQRGRVRSPHSAPTIAIRPAA